MSGTPRRDLALRDLPPADSTTPTSEVGSGNGGGSGDGAKADCSSKTKMQVEHLLATLEKDGVQIDDKIINIIDAEIAKIKAETSREAINGPKRGGITMWSAALACCGFALGFALFTVASISAGFLMGADWFEKAFLEEYARRTEFIIGADRAKKGEDK